jgi:predicted P-loop ATPase
VPSWRAGLIKSATGSIKAVRENIVLALDGMPERQIPGIQEAAGVIAFNEFTNDVIKLQAAPWGTPAGVWDEVDELEMGNWLTREHWLPPMPRGTLEEAVAMVSKRHRFHPVRQWLEGLRSRWDGTPRTRVWLRQCCLEEDEWDDADPLMQYLARVGTWLLMAICARVLTPGCKFDYMVIFEGAQGAGKSTLARLLGGDHFADTGLVLGDKDSYQNLQGVLVYEWGELDSLNRAEVTKVKQFVSSQKDRFRASFDRRPKDYPRQVVFIGTTNEDHYLVDITGNRRFWPVRITRQIDLDWFRANREQLFAEALHHFEAGERFHPTTAEQKKYFEPQQQQRQIENAIAAAVVRYLYDDDQRVGVHGENGTLVNSITVSDLLSRLGISVDKQTHVLQRQATAALRQVGWVRFRSSRGDRPWMFRRPEQPNLPDLPAGKAPGQPGAPSSPVGDAGASKTSTRRDAAAQPEGADSDCPF